MPPGLTLCTSHRGKHQTEQDLNIKARYLLIAVLPVAVFWFGDHLVSYYGNYFIEIPRKTGAFDHVGEAAGRYIFYGVFLLFGVIAASVTAIAGFDVHFRFKPCARNLFFVLVTALTGIVLVILLLWGGPKTYWLAGHELFDNMFANAAVFSCEFKGSPWQLDFNADSCVPGSMETVFIVVLITANALTALGAASAVAGTISCLGARGEQSDDWTGPLLNEQTQRLRYYLYLSSALMVAGVLLIMAWLHWPDSYVLPESAARYQTLISSLTLYFGFNYSLIIFSFYVPVALILSGKAALVPVEAGAATPQNKASVMFGTLPDTFRTALALLSPFMTAVLGSVPSFLTGSN
jgi:hypothetical protein